MRTITIANGLSVSADAARPPTVVSTDQAPTPRRVSYDGQDYTMRRPQIHVGINERVEAGQVLFSDKKNECLRVLSGVSGTVASIDLGARRSLQKLVVKVDAPVDNDGYPLPESVVTGLNSTHGNDIRAALVAAGLFHPFRTWPFNKTPTPDSSPRHIFVTAMDTNPYAADARAVLDARKDYFRTGLEIISKLTEGSVYVCQAPGEPLVDPLPAKVVSIGFKGPHPCGNTGTHIQAISPVSRECVVWSIDYQEVIAIGEAASTGRFSGNRTVSVYSVLSGHQYLISSLIGADLHSQLGLSTDHSKVRYWSGNPYTGGYADHLGRFDRQVFVMGPDQHSRQPDAGLLQKARFQLNSWRAQTQPALVAEPWLDQVTPLTNETVPLLRALICGDMETAEACGCLRFSAEDIQPLSVLCGGQFDFRELLQSCHRKIEDELSASSS